MDLKPLKPVKDILRDCITTLANGNLLFPPVCQNCGERTDSAEVWLCNKCVENLEELEPGLCPECGTKLIKGECFECGRPDVPWTEVQALYRYHDALRALIHKLKYQDKRKIADYLAEKSADWLKAKHIFSDAEIIVPVPLHHVRQRERGFNQAALLAERLGKLMNWEYHANVLGRTRATVKQSMVEFEDREKNVNNAFKVKKPELLTNKKVVVIDDIYTSGSTMKALCRTIKECNPTCLYVFTIGKVC